MFRVWLNVPRLLLHVRAPKVSANPPPSDSTLASDLFPRATAQYLTDVRKSDSASDLSIFTFLLKSVTIGTCSENTDAKQREFWDACLHISIRTHQTALYSLICLYFLSWLLCSSLIGSSLFRQNSQIHAVHLLDCCHCIPYQLINANANWKILILMIFGLLVWI